MIKSKLQDGEGKSHFAGVRHTDTFGNGLKTYTYQGNPLGLGQRFLTNEIYGDALNQNATTGGTPDKVHDGIDSSLWTASAISGTWTFNSTTVAHAGTRSISAIATVNNSVAQLDKGANLVLANYVTLTGWIYLTGWSSSGTKHVEIYGWDTALATQVSLTLNIDDYINTGTLNTWQKFSIPFVDLGFTAPTLDAVRIRTVDLGAGPPPNYYLDDIQFEETGGSIVYSVGPPKGEKWCVKGFNYIMADAYTGAVTNGTMPSIPYTGFLGVPTLTNGTTVRRIQFDEIQFSNTTTDFIDYIATAAPKQISSGSDGTNTWVRLEAAFIDPVVLNGDKGDKYELVVNDDLTGLLYYKANIVYGVAIDIQ